MTHGILRVEVSSPPPPGVSIFRNSQQSMKITANVTATAIQAVTWQLASPSSRT
jgi:hypothetical protein